MKTVKITIKHGKARVEVDGCQDASCSEITEAIERALGSGGGDKEFKPEYFQQRSQEQSQ